MMIKKYGIAFAFMMMSVLGFSQTRLPSITVDNIDKSTIFDELVELLTDSEFFIQNMDKDASFIQVKSVVKKRGIFAKRAADKMVYNMLLKPLGDRIMRIHLQANPIISTRAEDGYYYREMGVSDDPRDYEELLTFLENHFNQ